MRKDSFFFKELNEGKRLHVHRTEAPSLSSNSLLLSNGEALRVDALVFATGWRRVPASELFSLEDCVRLGLPVPLSSQPANLAAHWNRLDYEADREIQTRFPILGNPPLHNAPVVDTTVYHLYRLIVSPSLVANDDRSITFLSLAGSAHTVTYAELSALWAVAWMEGLLTPRPTSLGSDADREKVVEELEKEVALVNAFLRHRYLSSPKRPPSFILEAQTLFDTLIRDLGLEVDRRRGKWRSWGALREYLTPYECSDYAGVVEEMIARGSKIS